MNDYWSMLLLATTSYAQEALMRMEREFYSYKIAKEMELLVQLIPP